MVVLYQSQTLPVNPPGVTPLLNPSELWEIMLLKCRQPHLFVDPMETSHVIEETATTIKREVIFKADVPPGGGSNIEELELRKPWKVDFFNRTTGAFVNNTLSQGKDETDLYLTFYFEWPFPDMKEGSEEAKKTDERLWAMAKDAIRHTIDMTREKKKEGTLGK